MEAFFYQEVSNTISKGEDITDLGSVLFERVAFTVLLFLKKKREEEELSGRRRRRIRIRRRNS